MELTATALVAADQMNSAALAINNVFYGMDYSILEWYHRLGESTFGHILSPVLNAITLTGWKGAFLILVSLVLLVIPKTRRTGLCCLFSIVAGGIIVNVIVKNVVARPRPYDFDLMLRQWWEYAGSHVESDKSFPSGHMNVACAFTTGFVLSRDVRWFRRWIIPGALYVTLMGISRNFLIVHYPSDVVFGFFFGVCAGLIGVLIVRAVYRRWGESKLLREYVGQH